MKLIKSSMRLWITIASVGSFFMGWVLLSHAQKPAPLQISSPTAAAPVRSQQSIQAFNFNSQSNSGTNFFQFSNQQPQFFSSPRLRTGGS